MKYHKPDIVVILAIVVGAGAILTTSVQAGEVPGGDVQDAPSQLLMPESDQIYCDACPAPVRHRNVLLGSTEGVHRHTQISTGQSTLDSTDTRRPEGFVHARGLSYAFMYNSFRAVMYMGGGSVDVTLKVDNLHTPADDLNPYLSFSLGSRW